MKSTGSSLFDRMGEGSKAAQSLMELSKQIKEKPKSILVISAHYEEPQFTIVTQEKPTLFYDYYGFPPETYEIKYPVSHSKELEKRLEEVLNENKIKYGKNAKRGLDHGVFIPLKLVYPEADVPVVQLSLNANLDGREHLALGKALSKLREEGVLIFGSGFLTHNLAYRGLDTPEWASGFEKWSIQAATSAPEKREEEFADWKMKAGAHGKKAHPREEHLLPLIVVAGAAGESLGRVAYNELFGGMSFTNFIFEDN